MADIPVETPDEPDPDPEPEPDEEPGDAHQGPLDDDNDRQYLRPDDPRRAA